MKIPARISLGYGILLASILLLAVVQIVAVRNLQALNESASRSGLDAAVASLQLMQDGEMLRENVERFFRYRDPEAGKQIDAIRESYQADLEQLRACIRSDPEAKDLDRLTAFWKEFLETLWREQAASKPGNLPEDLIEGLDRIRTQARTVYQTSLSSIEARGEESRTIAHRAERISWAIAAGALVIGGLMSLLIVRSISIPLSSLAEGTRTMAHGESYYRLDTSRDDEIAQIAKDFNTITERLRSSSRPQ